ncbi:MAG: fibronectin type III domain-containing protein [Acidimicrobiales bacterium]
MSSRRSSPSRLVCFLTVGAATLAAVGASMSVAITSVSTPAAASPLSVGSTTFSVGTPALASITNGTTAAPWNTSQGDPSSTAYPNSDLFPTYTPGGPTTGTGASTEPNVAVYPSSNSGTDGVAPYPSGTVGTPGPLDGYCGTGNQVAESAGTPARQPAGTTLPFAPAYFPHVVKNADGSLTGYFDYRPKDADEALVAATSTDNGKDWTYDGEALEENPGYCPSADINDDGEGHANVITVGGNAYLYTLPRAAGDMQGVGMIVHQFSPTESSPLAGLPATEKVGIDPDAFVPTGSTTVSVTHGTAQTIPLTSLGTAGSPEQLVVGSFVDVTQTPGVPTVVTCTGLGTSSLTGCTTASGSSVSVHAGDLVEQVMGFTTPSSDVGLVIPAGPNTTNGDGGLASFTIDSTSGNPGFADPLTGTTFNNNAPNRLYVNGAAIYCSQANANPTTHIEDCTTGPTGSSMTLSSLEPITGDPIIPATSYSPGAGDGMTSGLVAPDGIVGVLPSYPNNGTVPSGATYVMYTEKELSYYVAGETGGSGTFNATTGQTISFTPGTYISSDMPSSEPVGGYTVQMGATAPSPSTSTAIITVTCTTLNETSGSLGGCKVPSAYNGWTYASNSLIGAPGATTLAQSTLSLTGEGKSSDISKLNKNNEDLTVLRVAYTTNGVTFSSSGLTNGGVISGAGCETGSCSNGGAYDDISSPAATANPTVNGQIDLNAYAAPGTLDATEMRWVGSAGTIVTNPNGTYGLFLSGAWAADGDSDAFNQIFYSESSDGEHWSVPQMVLSTDYTFAASVAQDQALAQGHDVPLGVSAYYEGRAYGPSVVQNNDGTLTMIFAGYRLPKTISGAGTTVGTNPNAPWTVGATDPALYRNILAVTLTPSTDATSTLTSQTTVTSSTANPVVGQPVTYSATVSDPSTGAGDPTGTVTFTDPAGTLCSSVAVTQDMPDTASCVTTYTGEAETDTVTATYSGDSTFSTSNGSTTVSVSTVPDAPTGVSATAGDQSASVSWTAAGDEGSVVTGYTVTATGDGTNESCTTPDGATTTCTVDGLTNGTAYTFTVTATNANGTGAPSVASSPVTPSTVPDAPTGVSATPGNQSATVSWTAAGDEGSAITGYTVTATGDGTNETCSSATTSCTVSGLTNGTAYPPSPTPRPGCRPPPATSRLPSRGRRRATRARPSPATRSRPPVTAPTRPAPRRTE